MLRTTHFTVLAGAALSAALATGCGDVVRQGRGPTQAFVVALEGAAGVRPTEFSGTLMSDVITNVKKTDVSGGRISVPTVFNDMGRVTMTLTLKDPGAPATPTEPTSVNEVTFTRYHVQYERADGRNTPGVDVPYAFDSAATFTAKVGVSSSASFELVRHVAKMEAPVNALEFQPTLITTVATVTFFGKDRAGNDVQASGRIGVTFGNFGDPD
jgi:hypothetical protein